MQLHPWKAAAVIALTQGAPFTWLNSRTPATINFTLQ